MPDFAQERERAAHGSPAERLRAAAAAIRSDHAIADSTAEAMFWRNLATLLDKAAIAGPQTAVELLVDVAEGYLLTPQLWRTSTL